MVQSDICHSYWTAGLLISAINRKLDLCARGPRFKLQLRQYFSLLYMYDDNKQYICHTSYLKTPVFDNFETIHYSEYSNMLCFLCDKKNTMFYSQNFEVTGLIHIRSNTMADSMLFLCCIVNLF